MPRFVLIDDHPIVLSGLTAVFRTHPRYEVAATGATAEQALHLVSATQCDILVADLHLLGDRFETIPRLRKLRPDLKIMIFTEIACPSNCLEVMKAGANAYILKDTSTDDFPAVIEMVLSGNDYISPELAPAISQTKETRQQRQEQLASIALSLRETQVADALLNGASNKEIAVKLNLSYKTVKFYMNQIMRKFEVRNRVEVVLELQRLKN